MTHTLAHALDGGCHCSMADIHRCVICGKDLEPARRHVDTCGERCFRTLLRQMRQARTNQPHDG